MNEADLKKVSVSVELLSEEIRIDDFQDGNDRLNYVNQNLKEISIFAKSKGIPFNVSAYDLINRNTVYSSDEESSYEESSYFED